MKRVCNVNLVYRNLKSENSQDYAQKVETSTKLYIHEFGFSTIAAGKENMINMTILVSDGTWIVGTGEEPAEQRTANAVYSSDKQVLLLR